jgi:hypothetical protein
LKRQSLLISHLNLLLNLKQNLNLYLASTATEKQDRGFVYLQMEEMKSGGKNRNSGKENLTSLRWGDERTNRTPKKRQRALNSTRRFP